MAMAPMCVCAGMDAFSTAKILTNRGEELEKVLRKLAPKVRFLLGKTWEDHGNITVIYIYNNNSNNNNYYYMDMWCFYA
jgi:hypothetical protein